MSVKNNISIDKFTSYLSNIPSKIMKAHPWKKAYGALWLVTGILLITEIALLIVYGSNVLTTGEFAGKNYASSAQINAIAAIAVVFVIFMMAAIFTTVFASMKLKKEKNAVKPTNKKVGK